MSGVEIVGLALAVLPVLISAAEFKRKRTDTRRTEFLTNLAYETWFLRTNLIKLAKGLTELPDEIREHLAFPDLAPSLADLWEADPVVRALRSHLSIGHDTFGMTLAAVLECLEKLVEFRSLELSNNEATHLGHAYAKLAAIRDSSASTPINSLRRRIRFAFAEGRKYEQILVKITENNKKLDNLIRLSSDPIISAPEPSPQESHAIRAPHIKLRPLMRNLYDALGDSWPCKCDCKHEAWLCLLQQRDARLDSVTGEYVPIHFDMIMSLWGSASGPEVSCRWLEIQLCIAPSTPPTRGVRFEPPPASVGSAATRTDNDETASQGIWRPPRTKKKIEKMCKLLLQADRNLCTPQILFDGDSLWHTTSKPSSRRSLRTSINNGPEVEMSLAALLGGERKFKMKEKRILPVILANALLHYGDTPWLKNGWNKEHVHFFSTPGHRAEFDINRPFLAVNFEEPQQDNDEEDDTEYRVHPIPSILALGILLLEIEHDSSLEEHYTDDDLADGSRNVNTDYLTALRLFEEISDTIYINHYRALSACLNFEFFDPDTMEPSFDDEQFRQAVYDNIVKPLELEMLAAYELTMDDLFISDADASAREVPPVFPVRIEKDTRGVKFEPVIAKDKVNMHETSYTEPDTAYHKPFGITESLAQDHDARREYEGKNTSRRQINGPNTVQKIPRIPKDEPRGTRQGERRKALNLQMEIMADIDGSMRRSQSDMRNNSFDGSTYYADSGSENDSVNDVESQNEVSGETDWWSDGLDARSQIQKPILELQPFIEKAANMLFTAFSIWNRSGGYRRRGNQSDNDNAQNPDSSREGATGGYTAYSSELANEASGSSNLGLRSRKSGDEDDHQPSQRRKLNPPTGTRLLACPFAKNNPFKHRKCFKYTMEEISRLKQHLTRAHQAPIHCTRCSQTFETEEERDHHVRRTIACETHPPRVWDCVSEAQRRQLSKRVSYKKTKEENWYLIYGILFPESRRPDSPYIEDIHLSEELLALREFTMREAPTRIAAFAQTQIPADLRESQDQVERFTQAAVRNLFDIVIERWMNGEQPCEDSTTSTFTEPTRISRVSPSIQIESSSGSSSQPVLDPRPEEFELRPEIAPLTPYALGPPNTTENAIPDPLDTFDWFSVDPALFGFHNTTGDNDQG